MKKSILCLLFFTLSACAYKNTLPLETDEQKAAYAVGFGTGELLRDGLKEQKLELDQFFAALRTSAEGKDSEARLTQQEREAAMALHEKRLAEIKKQDRNIAFLKNMREGEAYQSANAKSSNVIVLDSGLQYEQLQAGSGNITPGINDSVSIHFNVRRIDGTVIDSTVQSQEPRTILISQIIPGWREGMMMMREGGEARLVVPPELAYGESGAGFVGPGETLIFEIELLEIRSKK